MEQTLQARIRERVYHLWNDWCGQDDNNHYWLKDRAVRTAAHMRWSQTQWIKHQPHVVRAGPANLHRAIGGVSA